MTIPSVSKDTEHLELVQGLREMQNGTATLENRSANSYKVKHTITILTSEPTPRDVSE